MRPTNYSSFWMGDSAFEFNPRERDFSPETLIRLAGYKRAVANFVQILTGRTIPVVYNTGVDSYTEGSVVVLSAKLEEGKFDSAVGTALHEGSHCVLTTFPFFSIGHLSYLLTDIAVKNSDIEIQRHVFEDSLQNLRGVLGAPLRISDLQTNGNENVQYALKTMLNWVEDRRIDYYIFSKTPGYKGYYHALYDEIFRNSVIDQALRSKLYRTETWRSYEFRIINFLNPNTDLDALKGLRDVWNLLDIENISRLQNTAEVFDLALKMTAVVYRHIIDAYKDAQTMKTTRVIQQGKNQDKSAGSDDTQDSDESGQSGSGGKGDSDSDGSPQPTKEPKQDNITGDGNFDISHNPLGKPSEDSAEDGGEDDEDDESSSKKKSKKSKKSDSDSDDDSEKSVGTDSEDGGKNASKGLDVDGKSAKGDTSEKSEDNELSPNKQRKLEDLLNKQRSFVNGDSKKDAMSQDVKNAVDAISESGTTIKEVGKRTGNQWTEVKSIPCVVVNELTDSLLDVDPFRMFTKYPRQEYVDAVKRGESLGAVLGRKLLVRNDERTTVFNRLEKGRIDKKLLHTLGWDNTKIFFNTHIDKFKDVVVHISVDSSGSMSSNHAWENAMTATVAICKAASMVKNLKVVVSFRTTVPDMKTRVTNGNMFSYRSRRRGRIMPDRETMRTKPIIVIAYDSRKDSFSKVMRQFPRIHPSETTPEGLAFEAVLDTMVGSVNDTLDSYFVNLSDGQPYFSVGDYYYAGDVAAKHTSEQVNQMRSMGINVLSYFVNSSGSWGYNDEDDWEVFKKCYGKDAKKVDVTSVVDLARTLNELFLRKR